MPAIHRPLATERLLYETFRGLPFTAGQALRRGVTRERLAAAVGRGLVVRLHPGVYVPARVLVDAAPADVLRVRARGTLAVLPDAVVSHSTAAVVHGLAMPSTGWDPWRVDIEVTQPGARSRRACGLRVHASPLGASDRSCVDGLPTTTLTRTVADLARRWTFRDGLVLADAALRRLIGGQVPLWEDLRPAYRDRGLVAAARARLQATVDDQAGWPGSPMARKVARAADPGAESPLESWSRADFMAAGLPVPMVGVPVEGDDGGQYWVDMYWPEQDVVGEADGATKYDRPGALYREKVRQDAIERRGTRVVRWTSVELRRQPEVVVGRVRRALAERGWADGGRRVA